MKFKEIKPDMVIHCPTEEDAKKLLWHLEEIGYEKSMMPNLPHQYYRICDNEYVLWIPTPRRGTEITEFSDLIEPDDEVMCTSYKQEFYFSDFINEPLGGKWVESYDITDFEDGKYLWKREVLTYSNGITHISEPFCAGKCSVLREQILQQDSPINSPTDSPMSAVEVLEWLEQYGGTQVAEKVFGLDSDGYVIDRGNVLDIYSPQEIVDKITAYEAAKKTPKPVEVEEGYHCLIHASDSSGRYSADEIIADYELWDVDKETAEDDIAVKARDRVRAIKEQVWGELQFICRVKEDES